MKLDTSGLVPERLARFVADAYGLDRVALAFHPKGEASYSYLGIESNGARWLIKAQPTERMAGLEARLRAICHVHAERGFRQVVAPRQNRWGDCASLYEQYTVTVYPFIDGDTIDPDSQTDLYAITLAALLGAFHQHGRGLPVSIPRELFGNPSEAPILRSLTRVAASGALANPTQESLRALLLAQRENILATLHLMRQTTETVRGLALDWVLIHGDPNWENILVDRTGTFNLLDWDNLALGAPEHDLVFFSNRSAERFEAYLRQYRAINRGAHLHPEVFAYYWYREVVDQIAAFATRILFGSGDPAEAEQAWAELQPYVPTDHAAIAAGLQQVAAVLARSAQN